MSDDDLIAAWLHGRTRCTLASYAMAVRAFRSFVAKPLGQVQIADVHAYADSLTHLAPRSRVTRMGAVKSLLSFGFRLGCLPGNPGVAIRQTLQHHALAVRPIMSEAEVSRLLAQPGTPRDVALLNLLYAAGLEISEVCGLYWRDLLSRHGAGQATVRGRGGKVRVVLLPVTTWLLLEGIRGRGLPDAPVFASRRGGAALDTSAVHRIVKAAAKRAGLSAKVSARWLRHAHAAHSLDRGASVALVQATLGHAQSTTTELYRRARPGDSSARYLGL